MRRHRSSEVKRISWHKQAFSALAEFDSAQTSSQRMAALKKLQPLFAGNGTRKAALRKCLALTIKTERMGEWEICTERRHRDAARKTLDSSLPVNLSRRFGR
jgi:hypothetical protein